MKTPEVITSLKEQITGRIYLPVVRPLQSVDTQIEVTNDRDMEVRVYAELGSTLRVPARKMRTPVDRDAALHAAREQTSQLICSHLYREVYTEVVDAIGELAETGLWDHPAFLRLNKMLPVLRGTV